MKYTLDLDIEDCCTIVRTMLNDDLKFNDGNSETDIELRAAILKVLDYYTLTPYMENSHESND